MPPLLAAFLLGGVAGLRTLTAPAALWLMRRRSPAAYVLAALAVAEYAGDLHPKAPPRTRAAPLIARAASGACCGWFLTSCDRSAAAAGALAGAAGALAGAYGGSLVRARASAAIGPVAAALVEDAAAVAGAVAIVAFA